MPRPQGAPEEGLRAELLRLQAELEQARVDLEDSEGRASQLGRERDALQQQQQRHESERQASDATTRELRQQLQDALKAVERHGVDPGLQQLELQGLVEKLRVAGEELRRANEALRATNSELDRRVAERTAELTAANAALRDREARLALAMEHVGAASWEWVLRKERPGDVPTALPDWLESAIPEDRNRLERTLMHCLRQRKPELAVEFRVHDGKGERWIAARGRLQLDAEGRPLRIIGLSTDVTEHKAIEATLRTTNAELNRRIAREVAAREQSQALLFQKQKLEALGQLTGGVAHDFNNLLAVVSNGAYLLLKVNDPDRRAELVERLLTAVRRGSELTRRLLAFGRRQELRPERLDVHRSLEEFHELLRPSLQHGVELKVDAAEDTWPVTADNGELQLALLNLCLNARDAMPRRGIIELAVANRRLTRKDAGEWQLPPGDYVAFCVRDRGIGMSPEIAQHAFEPFFTTKDVGEGTGLGLAQVYGFARQSGGSVRIQAREGGGTEVTLLLPCAVPECEPAPDATALAEATRGAAILVVEDDEGLAALVAEALHRWDHEVTHVSTAQAALQRLAEQHYDLLFTDVLLPAGMNGLELARQARREHPGLRVVLTSGYGGELLGEAAAEHLPVLYKPYQLDTLQLVIGEALAGQMQRATGTPQ